MNEAEKLVLIAENEQRVYEAGQKEMWKCTTANGTRAKYDYAFQYTDLTYFEPKTGIAPTTAPYMFANSIGAVDLADKFKKNGVSLDFSNCSAFTRTFYNSKITKLGVIDCTSAKALDFTFGIMPNLHTIEKWIVDADNTFSNTFSSDSALEYIRCEGVIANDISFASCKKLTHDSIINDEGTGIINVLDTLESGVTRTLTLCPENSKNLTEDEKKIAKEKGWTLLS